MRIAGAGCEGQQVVVGGEDKYMPACRACYMAAQEDAGLQGT